MTPEWIDHQVGFLNAKIGLYQLSAGAAFLFEPTPGFYGFICQGSTAALNEAMRMLADHILAPSSPTIDPWQGQSDPLTARNHDWTKQGEPPGMIRYDGPLRSRIQIAVTNKHSPHLLGAILAHELTHHFLMNRGIGYPDGTENERLTDFATVFLGLGKLTLNGYNPISWSIHRQDSVVTYTYRVGYLSAPEIADAMCRVCAFRGIPLPEVEVNLTPQAIGLLRTARSDADRDDARKIRRAKWQSRKEGFRRFLGSVPLRDGEQTVGVSAAWERPSTPTPRPTCIVHCRKCGQGLRVPVTEESLRLICTKCKESFVLQARYGKGSS